MLKSLRNKKGQNTAEYAILIGLIVSAAIAMQVYVKRGVQGRMHDASNKFYADVTANTNWASITSTAATTLGTGGQFEPTGLSSKSTQETLAGTEEKSTYATGGTVTRESTRITKQAVDDYQKYDY